MKKLPNNNMEVPRELFYSHQAPKLIKHINCHNFILLLIILVLIFQIKSDDFMVLCSKSTPHKSNISNHIESAQLKHMRLSRAVYLASFENSRQNDSGEPFKNYASPSSLQDQPSILDQCCACDEAKYELVFEGLWSRYTHPDDFPENYLLAYFSDIIGASHSNEFRMWSPDTFASEGVKELAETGATKKLESELKQVSSKTRTIIKARELRYPTLNSKTSAVFRTDRQHHLVSILSKLGPSPDWMVGVSGLELCQSDCSWAVQRVVNLYLWDAGTDSGTSFTSADWPTRPQERIHPFSGSQKSHNESSSLSNQNLSNLENQYQRRNPPQVVSNNPSYSTEYHSGQSNLDTHTMTHTNMEQMKPFARLTVTRQRIYEKSCNGNSVGAQNRPNMQHNHHNHQQNHLPGSDSLVELTPPPYSDCRFSEWSDWSSCSSTCGKGIRTRTRTFIDEHAHQTGCSQVDLIEKEICLSECVGNATCVTRDWSDWSKCSIDCGQGFRKRTRSPIGPMKQACESVELVEMEPCTGSCSSDEPASCEVTEWSQWSECSVACGKGTRIRTRQYVKREDAESCNVKLIQKQPCNGRPELCKQVSKACPMPVDEGPCKAHIMRWYYDRHSGTCNKFTYGGCLGQSSSHVAVSSVSSQQQQQQNQKQINPNLPVIDCKLSNWSPWSTCSALCGSGKRTRSRYIIQMPQNGGKPCDKKLNRTQRCKDLPPCPQDYNFGSSSSHLNSKSNNNYRNQNTKEYIRTSSTTPASSMMDDEDDSKFSRLLKAESGTLQLASFNPTESYISDGIVSSTEMELIGEKTINDSQGDEKPPCKYGNWTQWSECEVVCQPVQKGSNKVRQRHPVKGPNSDCQILEELYYCDPKIYC